MPAIVRDQAKVTFNRASPMDTLFQLVRTSRFARWTAEVVLGRQFDELAYLPPRTHFSIRRFD